MNPTRKCNVLSARDLGRKDQGKIRLSGFNLDLHQGETVGLLGVNGAGKSTALALLSGALAPGSGCVEILGINLHQHPRVKKHIGLLPETPPLYANLSIDENLDFAARLRGVASSQLPGARESVKKRLGLHILGKRLCGRLSKGMAQRVAIAQALVHSPKILILDEPTAGLDPAQAQELRELIRELAGECGIILASHILADMEQLCQRVIVLNNGQQVAEQTLDNNSSARIQLGKPPADPAQLLGIASIRKAEDRGNGWYQLELDDSSEELAEQLVAAGWRLQALIPSRHNLQSLLTAAIVSTEEQP
ncbi:ABC transporter ATP-binding protein [Thiolapillus sp.]